MISSSRSTLYRFLSLYAALYAGFGVQSPYLPILLDSRHLSPETIALALAAGTAMRLTAAPAIARLADRFDAPRAILALCSAVAGVVALGVLPPQEPRGLVTLGGRATAARGPPPAAQRYGRPRYRGSRRVRRHAQVEISLRLAARVRLGRLCRRLGDVRPGHRAFRHRRHRLAKRGIAACRVTRRARGSAT